MNDAIQKGNTQKTFKKIMDGHFSNFLRHLKNGQKSNSFASHFEHHFKSTTSHTYLRMYMAFKVVHQISLISAIKNITKPNCNLCMEKSLKTLKTNVKTRPAYEQ